MYQNCLLYPVPACIPVPSAAVPVPIEADARSRWLDLILCSMVSMTLHECSCMIAPAYTTIHVEKIPPGHELHQQHRCVHIFTASSDQNAQNPKHCMIRKSRLKDLHQPAVYSNAKTLYSMLINSAQLVLFAACIASFPQLVYDSLRCASVHHLL